MHRNTATCGRVHAHVYMHRHTRRYTQSFPAAIVNLFLRIPRCSWNRASKTCERAIIIFSHPVSKRLGSREQNQWTIDPTSSSCQAAFISANGWCFPLTYNYIDKKDSNWQRESKQCGQVTDLRLRETLGASGVSTSPASRNPASSPGSFIHSFIHNYFWSSSRWWASTRHCG